MSEPPPPEWHPTQRKKKNRSFTLDKADMEMIDWLADFLGASKSEAVRTAVRSFAGQMASLEKKRGRPLLEKGGEADNDT